MQTASEFHGFGPEFHVSDPFPSGGQILAFCLWPLNSTVAILPKDVDDSLPLGLTAVHDLHILAYPQLNS